MLLINATASESSALRFHFSSVTHRIFFCVLAKKKKNLCDLQIKQNLLLYIFIIAMQNLILIIVML